MLTFAKEKFVKKCFNDFTDIHDCAFLRDYSRYNVVLGNAEINLSLQDQFTQNPSLNINPVACARLPSISSFPKITSGSDIQIHTDSIFSAWRRATVEERGEREMDGCCVILPSRILSSPLLLATRRRNGEMCVCGDKQIGCLSEKRVFL